MSLYKFNNFYGKNIGMLINGAISSEKTDILVEEYSKLINSGVSASKIIVILQSSSLKEKFINNVYERLSVNAVENIRVYSFYGLVYNTIVDNWVEIENKIPNDKSVIIPNLVGLEVSQFIMKDILKEVKFEGYNSKKSLLHQLFRRFALIVQNNLEDSEIEWRSKNVLKEGFSDNAKEAIKTLITKTLNYRSFDYLRQGKIFNYVYKNTDYFRDVEYLFVDDGDEVTPICFEFISHLAPQLKKVFITCDEKGSSRSGYLSADKNIYSKFENLFNEKFITLNSKSGLSEDAESIFKAVITDNACKFKHIIHTSPSKRASMIDVAVFKINSLIKSGINPSEISIVTPVIDDMLNFSLKNGLRANVLFLSGSEKLIQNSFVQASLTILKMTSDLKKDLNEFNLRVILDNFLHIPIRHCEEILKEFQKSKVLIDYEFKIDEYNKKYKKLKTLLDKLALKKMRLSEQVYVIYKDLIEFRELDRNELKKFSFFVKQLQDFESVFSKEFIEEKKEEIINQIENSIIAENPYSNFEIGKQEVVVATPQKIIDNQIKSKYQFWLDISSGEWIKNDTGPLYNAWVFQKDWAKEEYTVYDDKELAAQKTARILRKLVLLANKEIYAYSSLFDGIGVENFGGIEKYFISEKKNNNNSTFKIIPRDDQKPVLEYTSGKMAISAVPGAGKTTILLALIIKLLNDGIKPENIYVLTYMESAARNFRERIKNINQQSSQLPNISTIHGLALKILKDNSNFERIGLVSDFEICDDSQKLNITSVLAKKMKLKKGETDDFIKAISALKIGGGKIKSINNDTEIKKFVDFYREYEKYMKENNLIDYDDMLVSSVKLLEENNDILEYYQDICKFIIEDEAQDSSSIQQRLINLLSSKSKNLIRCGDINQAITTTFSNADVEGFRQFIEESNKVSMDCSQRCSEGVWKLANALVEWAENNEEYKKSFYKIFMQPVFGKNPVSEKPVIARIFEKTIEEKNYVLKQIKNILTKEKNATIGILLRSNWQVANWLDFVNNSGFKSISRSECLEQKGVFKTIFAILNMILYPFDNEVIAKSYETLAELGFYKSRLQVEIKKLNRPFVQMSVDDIANIDLQIFYWDLVYWLSFPSLPIEELAIKIGLNYYKSDIEKSNVYLISTLIKRISANNKSFEFVIKRLAELAKKSNLSEYNFFSEESESDKEFLAGKVQIMTYHKSKGDEFDYVFLPELSENNLNLSFEQLELKKSSIFLEKIRQLNPDYDNKSDYELKKLQIAENLRLLYVAITRAKKNLTMTVTTNIIYYGKEKIQEPNLIFSEILGGVCE